MITQLWVGVPVADTTVLSSDEVARADGMGNAAAAQEFRASRSWLRLILGEWLGRAPASLEFRYGKHGKPLLDCVEFNLAHSHGVTAIAVSDRPIGVDIEPVGRLHHRSLGVRRSFQSRDFRRLTSADRVTAAWTAKEAHAKAIGTGHATAFSSLTLDPPTAGWIGHWRVDNATVSVFEEPVGYAVAISDHEFVVRRAGVLGGQVVRDPVGIIASPMQQNARRLSDKAARSVGS